MTNVNRDYGLDWERELVKIFKEFDDRAARMPNSGAFGTQTNNSALQGDVKFNVDGLPFLVEAKAGYGGSKSITLQREWMDKTIKEATNQIPKRFPILALKLREGRTESSRLIVLTITDFIEIMRRYLDTVNKLRDAYNRILELENAK